MSHRSKGRVVTKRVKLVGIGCVLALLGLLASFLVLGRFRRAGDGWRPTVRSNLNQLALATQMYHETHGVLPSDPRGQEYAMYLLRDILQATPNGTAPLFIDPQLQRQGVPCPRFDGARSIVTGSQVDYLNEAAPPDDDRVVIFAEKASLGKKQRHFVTWRARGSFYTAEGTALDRRPLVGLKWTGERLVPRQLRLEDEGLPSSRQK